MRRRPLAVSMALGIAACAGAPKVASTTPPRLAGEYFALRIGARWTYEIDLLGAKKINDVKMVKENRDGFFEDSTGAQFRIDPFGVRDQRRYLLRNPVAVGTSWTNVVSVSSVEHYQVVGAGEACSTRAGRWEDCATVESRNEMGEGQALINRYTLAPGVGIVTLRTVLESGEKVVPQVQIELVEFAPP